MVKAIPIIHLIHGMVLQIDIYDLLKKTTETNLYYLCIPENCLHASHITFVKLCKCTNIC